MIQLPLGVTQLIPAANLKPGTAATLRSGAPLSLVQVSEDALVKDHAFNHPHCSVWFNCWCLYFTGARSTSAIAQRCKHWSGEKSDRSACRSYSWCHDPTTRCVKATSCGQMPDGFHILQLVSNFDTRDSPLRVHWQTSVAYFSIGWTEGGTHDSAGADQPTAAVPTTTLPGL